MTENEYELLQKKLARKLTEKPYACSRGSNREEGYKQGILAAKSMLSEIYHNQVKPASEVTK